MGMVTYRAGKSEVVAGRVCTRKPDLGIDAHVLPLAFEDCERLWVGKLGLAGDEIADQLRAPMQLKPPAGR